jgi:hypothetical protein
MTDHGFNIDQVHAAAKASESIVRQLRAWSEPIASGFEVPAAASTLHRAADEIERLRASNAELVAALRPFAAVAQRVEERIADYEMEFAPEKAHRPDDGDYESVFYHGITMGDFRRARAAIASAEGGEG